MIMMGMLMDTEVISAVLRLFKGWDSSTCISQTEDDLQHIEQELLSSLIAVDLREFTISKTVAHIAVRIWGTDIASLNNTFHKSFSTVEDSDYKMLVYQQLLNYLTTYGAEFFGCYDSASVYIPTEDSEIPEAIRGLRLTIIRPYTPDEIRGKITALALQSIGLSNEVLGDLMTLYRYYLPTITAVDIADLPNRELKIRLYDSLKVVPTRADEFLRHCVFKATGKTLLIKNRRVIKDLRDWSNTRQGSYYLLWASETLDPRVIAQSYHRYHEYWLALKQKQPQTSEQKSINAFINRIARLADRHHKPLPLNVLQNVCDSNLTPADIERAVRGASDVQLLKTWGYLRFVTGASSTSPIPRNYNIRNNRIWTRQITLQQTGILHRKIEPVLVELRKRFAHLVGKRFYIPDTVIYPLYSSGKKSVGMIPRGTVFNLPLLETTAKKTWRKAPVEKEGPDKNIIVAIHWFDVDERVDLDLHVLMLGGAVGWNSRYRTERCEIVYSGDMTAAPKPVGATEAVLVKGEMKDLEITFSVNNYTMNMKPVPYDIIIARGNVNDVFKNCVIDPNKVIAKISTEMAPGQAQQEVGILIKAKDALCFVVGGFATGNNRVSSVNEIQILRREAAKLEFLHYPGFIDFLRDVVRTFELVSTPEEADFDLSLESLQADTFSRMLFPQ